MRRTSKSDLQEHVRVAMIRIRKLRDARQEDFAKLMDVQRSAYTKKEKGIVPISLSDIDALIKQLGIGLADLFRGYPGFYYEPPPAKGLSEQARERFPFLDQVVMAANQAAEGDEDDLHFLKSCMNHASNKLEK